MLIKTVLFLKQAQQHQLTYTQLRHLSKKIKKSRFFDSLRIYARAGPGGQGFPKHGGIGGAGGNIIVRAKKGSTFQRLVDVNEAKRYTAGAGENASRHKMIGAPGEDQIIPVPVGVVVKNELGHILGDLDVEGEEVVAVKGGEGGGPLNNFLGKKGEAQHLVLDLKLIADVGLVGFPNAGKSTFLSAISKAKPKIAEYPFTTIRPQLGTMEYKDFRKISVADLPGLIEGAHINFGMGHKFLKHVERTKLLLFMIDINGFQLKPGMEERTAFETILLLNKELELYNPELLQKPAVIALNKIDTDEHGKLTDSILDQIKRLPASLSEVDEDLRPSQLIKFSEVYKMSTMFDLNIDTMKNRLRRLMDIYSEQHQETVKHLDELGKQSSVFGKEQSKVKVA